MASLPYADLDSITGGRTTLVLAPHPDDESLGCGGLIAEACARGRPPVVAVLTDGTMSHPNSPSHPAPRLRALREAEAQAAVESLGLGAHRLYFLGLRDSAVPTEGPDSRPPRPGWSGSSATTTPAASWSPGSTTRIRTMPPPIAWPPRRRGSPACGSSPIRSGAGPCRRTAACPAGRPPGRGSTSPATCRPSAVPSRRMPRSIPG
ncbi:PIG-L deacetylase family protein [Paeniroseomonas aquatica]|uniref:PIG-L deacetylase family protein n=1 Tax=Paeniroseomonas aquatica TaxID=373043 RepID=UPI00362329E0